MPDKDRTIISKLRGILTRSPFLPRAIDLVWTAAPRWTVAWIVLLVVQGVLPAATVYLIKLLVDGLVAALGSGDPERLRQILIFAALVAAVLLLTEVLRSTAGWVRTAQSELVHDHISSLIHERSVAVDLAFYESPEFYDRLHRARTEAAHRPVALLEGLGSLLQNGITLLAMGAVLLPYGWWLPVALLVSTLPAFHVVLRYAERHYQWRARTTADQRRTWYHDWLLTSGETAAEIRLFGLGSHFERIYRTLRYRLRNGRLRLARQQSLAEQGAGIFALLITGGALVWMVWRAFLGTASLGDVALFYQAFSQGQRLMRSLLENAGQIYSNLLFLGDLFEFLAFEPRVVDPAQPKSVPSVLKSGIHFERVTFRYPGSQRAALRDFDLVIPAGHLIAIVGPNGAGKSTLIKLLCRLYDPEAGRITLDGIDLRDLSLHELRRKITVSFQEPVHYNARVSENIRLGDVEARSEDSDVEAAAQAVGADETVASLPEGYDTLLGKWFVGGTELSTGEWRRLSLARAFFRQAPIIALDEPTGAMDPWAEADWMGRVRAETGDRTAIIVTHRLTTAVHTDTVHVMVGGRVVESGHHSELVSLGGLYAQSWTAGAAAGAR